MKKNWRGQEGQLSVGKKRARWDGVPAYSYFFCWGAPPKKAAFTGAGLIWRDFLGGINKRKPPDLQAWVD